MPHPARMEFSNTYALQSIDTSASWLQRPYRKRPILFLAALVNSFFRPKAGMVAIFAALGRRVLLPNGHHQWRETIESMHRFSGSTALRRQLFSTVCAAARSPCHRVVFRAKKLRGRRRSERSTAALAEGRLQRLCSRRTQVSTGPGMQTCRPARGKGRGCRVQGAGGRRRAMCRGQQGAGGCSRSAGAGPGAVRRAGWAHSPRRARPPSA